MPDPSAAFDSKIMYTVTLDRGDGVPRPAVYIYNNADMVTVEWPRLGMNHREYAKVIEQTNTVAGLITSHCSVFEDVDIDDPEQDEGVTKQEQDGAVIFKKNDVVLRKNSDGRYWMHEESSMRMTYANAQSHLRDIIAVFKAAGIKA